MYNVYRERNGALTLDFSSNDINAIARRYRRKAIAIANALTALGSDSFEFRGVDYIVRAA